MSIGAAPNIAGGLSVVAAGGWGRNLQQGVDPFGTPDACCLPGNPACCQPGDPACCQATDPTCCGNGNGASGSGAGLGTNNGPVVSPAMIAGASPPYPAITGETSCTCNPATCPPPPPGSGPYCAHVTTTDTSSTGVANVPVYCIETGGWLATSGCPQGCTTTFYFDFYTTYHFLSAGGMYVLCSLSQEFTYAPGTGSGVPGPTPSCTTIPVTCQGP